MTKRKKTLSSDPNELAHRLVNISTVDKVDDIELPTKAQVSLLMSELGRKGGKIGGKRRMETMSSKERQNVARKAAQARWASKSSE